MTLSLPAPRAARHIYAAALLACSVSAAWAAEPAKAAASAPTAAVPADFGGRPPAAVQGKAGVPLSATISVSAPGATSVSVSLSGVPLGMVFTAQGSAISMRWAQPVAGSYALLVVARDSLGRSAQATMPVTITAP